MTSTRAAIVSSAERTFDHHGFTVMGMDRLTEVAGVSTRTLYKHVGSKSRLMVAVLEERAARFFAVLPIESVDALFTGLGRWIAEEGSRGCLFLRAQGETGGEDEGVSEAVASYRDRLRVLIRRVVARDLGHDDERTATQVLLLFEGATSAAAYLGPRAVERAASGEGADPQHELAHRERLREVVVGPELDPGLLVIEPVGGRQHEDRRSFP